MQLQQGFANCYTSLVEPGTRALLSCQHTFRLGFTEMFCVSGSASTIYCTNAIAFHTKGFRELACSRARGPQKRTGSEMLNQRLKRKTTE